MLCRIRTHKKTIGAGGIQFFPRGIKRERIDGGRQRKASATLSPMQPAVGTGKDFSLGVTGINCLRIICVNCKRTDMLMC